MTTPPPTTKNAFPPVHVLYFNVHGHGPDDVFLQFETIDLRMPDKAPNLGLRVHAGDLTAMMPVGGGFMMDRDQVVTMHAQLAEWLGKHPAVAVPPSKEESQP